MISVDDWGFRYGWGAFESLRVHKRRPLFLQQHLARLWRTVELLAISNNVTPATWEREIARTISRAQLKEGMINLYWTAGHPPDMTPVRIVSARTSSVVRNRHLLDAWVAPWRIEPTTPGIGAKTMAYFPYMFAAVSAKIEGHDAAIVLNTAGYVADGAISSVFVVKGKTLTTPRIQDGALDGITRAIILESAHELGIDAQVRRVSLKQLHDADAIMLASALQGITTVRNLSGLNRQFKPSQSSQKLIRAIQDAYNQRIRLELADISAAF